MLISTDHDIVTAHKNKILQSKDCFAFKHSNTEFILLINVKITTIVGMFVELSVKNVLDIEVF